VKEVAEVVFLDIKPYSESSLWVCFFSEKHGLQNGIIKGGKKKKTKPFILGLYQLTFYRWSSSGLQNITSVERSENLQEIYGSPVKILVAFFVAESIKSFLNNEVVDQSFFRFIKSEVLRLNITKTVKAYPVFFLAELIAFSGHTPLKPLSPLFKVFDLTTSEFDPERPSGRLVTAPDLVKSLYDVFYNKEGFKGGFEPKLFDLLLEYCLYHLPGYNSKKSVEIIRETLYG
jgi:hypothetical protein